MSACHNWYDEPTRIGPSLYKLDGKVVSAAELVSILRQEGNPRLLQELSRYWDINTHLTDWEKKSESQKWMFPGG